MKTQGTIGLLGGASWVATIPYYETLNRMVGTALGGFHSARIMLRSMDYHPIKSSYYDWDKVTPLFAEEYRALAATAPDCIILACNTLHRAYDAAREELAGLEPRFLHAVELTRDACVAQGMKKVLLLGTPFTMRDDPYFIQPLQEAGLDVSVPDAAGQQAVKTIQQAVAAKQTPVGADDVLARLVDSHNPDGVVLACTELPLAFSIEKAGVAVVDPMLLQCRAAIDMSLGSHVYNNR